MGFLLDKCCVDEPFRNTFPSAFVVVSKEAWEVSNGSIEGKCWAPCFCFVLFFF